MKIFLRKKITLIWQKTNINFEMVQFGTIVPKKKGGFYSHEGALQNHYT